MPSWCHCHLLSLASVKSRLVLPFWYRPTRVVLEKGPLNGCVCACVRARVWLTCSDTTTTFEAVGSWWWIIVRSGNIKKHTWYTMYAASITKSTQSSTHTHSRNVYYLNQSVSQSIINKKQIYTTSHVASESGVYLDANCTVCNAGLCNGRVSVHPSVCPVNSSRLSIHICHRH